MAESMWAPEVGSRVEGANGPVWVVTSSACCSTATDGVLLATGTGDRYTVADYTMPKFGPDGYALRNAYFTDDFDDALERYTVRIHAALQHA